MRGSHEQGRMLNSLAICLRKVKEMDPPALSGFLQGCAVTLAMVKWAVPLHEAFAKWLHSLTSLLLLLCRYTKPQPVVDLMTQIKKTFDPNGILNPYKVLPQVQAVAQ